MSAYPLDGIKTAMDEDESDDLVTKVDCPCGWRTLWVDYGEYLDRLHALRFHYTHCPQARVAPTERAEP